MNNAAQNLERIIERNLYDSYDYFSECNWITLHLGSAFKWIRCDCSAWPNMVYHLEPEMVNNAGEYERLTNQMKSGTAPPYLIHEDTPAYAPFEKILAQKSIRRVSVWPGMALLHGEQIDTTRIQNTNVRFDRVKDSSLLESWIDIVQNSLFQNQYLNIKIFEYFLCRNRIRYYLAFADARPVSAAMLFINSKIAGIYMVSTLQDFRKQGIATGLVRHLCAEATLLGARTIVLEANQKSYPIYERIGFKPFNHFNIYWMIGKYA